VVEHFYHKDEYVPIWAIFEVISLAEFGNFVACANINMKRDIARLLDINVAYDTDGKMTERSIFLLKDLRNALAHNDAIFDTRFKRSNVNQTLSQMLTNETNIPNITFNTIVDYLILMIYLQKNMKVAKTELQQIVKKFEVIADKFRKNIPVSIFNQILYTDTRNKLQFLKNYIKI
ncbi:MAG: Abi family protein, partial [Bacillales bacterium]|nr:Abi family protein [Bacillales bacterium]